MAHIHSKKLDRSKQWPKSIHEWHERVSQTEIETDEGDVIVFTLDAYGMGVPSQILDISIKYCAEGLSFGIGSDQMDKLADWLLTTKYLERTLRERKEKKARKLEKERRSLHDLAKTKAEFRDESR
jgi:hypothetical protein